MNIYEMNYREHQEQLKQRTKAMRQLLNEVFNFYGCQKCNLCCKAYTPVVFDWEIKRISKVLRTKPKKFRKKYLVKLNLPLNEYELKSPCPFLKDNVCSIYPVRPKICRIFPFELEPMEGIVRLTAVEVCPTATLIYNDLLEYHEKYKHLIPISKEENDEMAEIMQNLEKMFAEKRKENNLPQSVPGIYAMVSIMQIYFFYLYRIAKVDNLEERIKNFYKRQRNFG